MKAALILLLALPLLAHSPEASAQDPTGTWNVVSTPTWNTCSIKNTKSAYQWILVVNGNRVSVSVQGKTAFPSLTGVMRGNQLLLEGRAKKPTGSGFSQHWDNSVFRLKVGRGGKISGQRFYVGRKAVRGGQVACVSTFKLMAKKQ